MNHKLTLSALAATSLLALCGASFANDTQSAVGTDTTAATTSKTTDVAIATVGQAVPFKGTVQSFHPGTDGKSIIVQNKEGEWFTLNFGKECKAIDGAKSVKLTQESESANGWVYVGQLHCKVASFAKANAPDGTAAIAPTEAAPITATPVEPHSDSH
jgi:hypothetical protein